MNIILPNGPWVVRLGANMREKRQRFVKLAEARVNKTLKDIQLIGNLSNSAAYEYDEADVKKIFAALQAGLNDAKSRFAKGNDPAGSQFKL